MILVATVVTLYTLMGGLWADTALDFMQMFLTCVGLILIMGGIITVWGSARDCLTWPAPSNHAHTFAIWPTRGWLLRIFWHPWLVLLYRSLAGFRAGRDPSTGLPTAHLRCEKRDSSRQIHLRGSRLYLDFWRSFSADRCDSLWGTGRRVEGAQLEFVLVTMAMKFLPPFWLQFSSRPWLPL